MNFSGAAKLHLDANKDAVTRLRRAIGLNPNFPVMHFALAGALANLGRMEEARAETHAGLALDPKFTVRSFRLGAESDNPVFVKQHERSADIMRKAGMPDG
jgi:predicted Zn-dependent protease